MSAPLTQQHLCTPLKALTLLAVGVLMAALSQAQVGAGDNRDGYQHADFVTRTRSVNSTAPADADLAAMAAKGALGLPVLSQPPSQALIVLGRRLFFDRRLSANDTLSCGMCHVPEQAFTQNELATPVGIAGALVVRNAPSLYNVAFHSVLFHDGRETDLAQQIWAPLLAANEMGNSSREAVVAKVRALPEYRDAFTGLFEDGVSDRSLGAALAAYQRALISANSPFDRWYYGGEPAALSTQAQQGFGIFLRSGCAGCHLLAADSALFSDYNFHNTGVGMESARRNAAAPATVQLAPGVFVPLNTALDFPDRTDYGRQTITGDIADRWKFRTPALRNVALSAPYMHDGSIATLAEVVSFYNRGGGDDDARDSRIRPLLLNVAEQAALVSFLQALTSDNVDILAADARAAPIGER